MWDIWSKTITCYILTGIYAHMHLTLHMFPLAHKSTGVHSYVYWFLYFHWYMSGKPSPRLRAPVMTSVQSSPSSPPLECVCMTHGLVSFLSPCECGIPVSSENSSLSPPQNMEDCKNSSPCIIIKCYLASM